MIVNQFGPGDFIHGPSWFDDRGRYAVAAEAITDAVVVRVAVRAVEQLAEVGPLLARDRDRRQARIAAADAGRHVPPDGMTQEVAGKLLLGLDLLRIDMDLCARCDECVAGCAAGHDALPRFHRANPKLSFGRWEVARACVHCPTAPCQAACAEKGAITFRPDGLVHVHHDRCTGCANCVPACPFEVIAMHLPAAAATARSLEVAENGVATKCDRCLTIDGSPPCVTSCPYGASARGSPYELFPRLREWAEGGGG